MMVADLLEPLQPRPERITRAEFARRVGVNRKTVTRWIQTGRLTLGADNRLEFETADRERLATESPLPHHQALKARFEESRRRQAMAAESSDIARGVAAATPVDDPALDLHATHEDLGRALKLETYRLQKAKAEQANLELDKAAGLLVDRAEVDFVLADIGHSLRGLLEGLPDRLAPVLAGQRGDVAALHKLLDDAMRDVLVTLADHMSRRLEQVTQ